ncbi:hypothetical protein F5146DRAFT_487411 [Armillaria mellea]|nr:hypothetical protein F5146DRAFT_487411 [Armillaria mellea]
MDAARQSSAPSMNRNCPLTVTRTEMVPISLQQIHAFLEFSAPDGAHQYHRTSTSNCAGRFDGTGTTGTRSYEDLDKANGTGNNEFPSYLVGEDTTSTSRSINLKPNANIRGEFSTTAELLADFIPHPTRLLYPTADKNPNRDALSGVLGGVGICFILPRCTGSNAAPSYFDA